MPTTPTTVVEQEVKVVTPAPSYTAPKYQGTEEKPVEEKAEEEKAEQVVEDAEKVDEEENKDEPEKPEKVSENQEKAWERIRRQRNEFKVRAEYAESMLRQGQQAPQQQQQQAPADKPQRDQFESDTAYIDAVTDWKLEHRLNGIEQRVLATQQQNTILTEWNGKLAEARKEYGADFDDALADAMDIPITPVAQEAILSSPRGADITYYLATNRDEALRIMNLPPARAMLELGKIEAYIEAEKKSAKDKPVKKVSTAPEPIKGPKAGTAGGQKSFDQMTPAEWRVYQNRKERERKH